MQSTADAVQVRADVGQGTADAVQDGMVRKMQGIEGQMQITAGEGKSR